MSKLIKYLKPFTASILAVIVLLFAQAMFDLSLPDYMSNIVNVGIQQGGIENAVPKVISKSEFDKLTLFMSKDEKEKVESNYTLLDKGNLPKSEYDKYVKDYPALEKENIYKLNTKDKEIINELNPIMGKAMIVVGGIEEKGLQGVMGNSSLTGASDNSKANMEESAHKEGKIQGMPANTDPFFMIKNMPEAQKNDMLKQINEKFESMPESMVTQTAATFIKDQYTDLGMNIEKIQSQYILKTGGIMILLAFGSMIAAVSVTLIAARVAAGFGRNLRSKVFGKVVRFSNAEFDKFSTASLITRSTNDIQQIQTLMVLLLRIVFYAPILGLGGIFRVVKTDTGMSWIIAVALAAILSLVIVLFFGKSITISSSNFRFSSTTDYILGNEVLWSVDTPELFFPFLFVTLLLFSFGIDKLWSNPNVIETNGIIFDNKVIDVWWGNRNDLTDGQIKTLKLYYSRQESYPFWIDIYKSILIDSLWFYGRSTVRQWHMFNVFLAFIMYNFVVTYTIEPSILRYTLYIYLTYTVITMICRRLMDTNSSIFWLICLFVPLVNIYVLYLLYNKTSALYDQESNSIFYYPL